mmetsp:Transcript_8515/g.13263  ORF Transcript_8515/g.13263 Transcript_8515/m.13263 type:complete len:85 (-) Transcript_8515:10-264(-)
MLGATNRQDGTALDLLQQQKRHKCKQRGGSASHVWQGYREMPCCGMAPLFFSVRWLVVVVVVVAEVKSSDRREGSSPLVATLKK